LPVNLIDRLRRARLVPLAHACGNFSNPLIDAMSLASEAVAGTDEIFSS
jgi:hypothetical protein